MPDVKEQLDSLVQNLLECHDVTGQFTQELADGRVVDTKKWTTWDWQQGVGLYGVWTLYQRTGVVKYRDILVDWFEENIPHPPPKNINTMCPLLTLAFLYEEVKDPRYLAIIEEWGSFIMEKQARTEAGCFQHTTSRHLNEEQIWDDTLFMTVLPLAKIGKLLKKPDYINEAKRQFLLHSQFLFEAKSGLFNHGWCFIGRHHYGEVKWGRGNAWLTVAIPELYNILEIDPVADAHEPFNQVMNAIFVQQVNALEKYQHKETGMYYTVIDAPEDNDNYLESSATAGFSCGIHKGIKLGLLDPKRYQTVADKGTDAVIKRIKPDGELSECSFGTRVGKDKQWYYDIPLTAMPYGQALAIMNLLEVL